VTASADRRFDLTNSEPLFIGFGSQTYFTGDISDLRLYSRALDQEELLSLRAD
jgi:hypothetical protein